MFNRKLVSLSCRVWVLGPARFDPGRALGLSFQGQIRDVRKTLVFGIGSGLYGNHIFSVFVAGHQTGEPSRNVRLWLQADYPTMSRARPFCPQEPTFKPHVRFRADCVCFTFGSRPSWWCRRMTACDPKRTFIGLRGSADGCGEARLSVRSQIKPHGSLGYRPPPTAAILRDTNVPDHAVPQPPHGNWQPH